MLTVVVLMALVLVMLLREREAAWDPAVVRPGSRRDALPANVLARNENRDGRDSGSFPVPPRKVVKFPVRRSFMSRLMVWVGTVGLVLSALWWVVLIILLFFPDPGAHDSLYINSSLTLIGISVLLPVLFLVLLRSGLRGPADPLAPENNHKDELRDVPLSGDTPAAHGSRGRKHLRLVRPSL